MKTLLSTLAIVAVLSFVSNVHGQRQAGQRGALGNGQPGMNQGQQGNQNGNQNMPTVQQLAQMMITNFDADVSGELSQSELQNALSALREKMRSQGNFQQGNANPGNRNQAAGQGNGQRQGGPQQNRGANRQRPQSRQGGQVQGNRPASQTAQGRPRRGR